MKSNIRLLTKEERHNLNNYYVITLKDDVVSVKVRDYQRITYHSVNSNFSVNSKFRKITFSKEAIDIWKTHFLNTDYTLIDVQNAVNALLIGYQNIEYEDVLNQLEVIDAKDKSFKI